MIVTVYHASPNLFSEFNTDNGGSHFGGMDSAYIAIERKLDNPSSKFYLYTVKLDISDSERVDDVGNTDAWEELRTFYNRPILAYFNKYEPSSTSSYVVYDKSKILSMTVEETTLSKMERKIDDWG